MNHKELQALRKLLMLEVNEAAEHIGGVKARTWYYWEEGRNPIPPEVAGKMLYLKDHRTAKIENITMRGRGARPALMPYFPTFGEYEAATRRSTGSDEVVNWRISQSVVAYCYAEGMADLI